jgi:integrase
MATRTRIFKRQDRHDGRWASCPTIEGKRRWFYGQTEQEVQDQVDEARYLAKRGRIIVGTSQTVEHFLEEWLAGKTGVRESSHTMYEIHIRNVLPSIGAIRLTKLTPRHLQLCYAELGTTRAPRTILTMHAILHQAFERAVKWDLLARNPADGVELPKATRSEMRTLSREQLRILIDGTAGTRWHAFFALMGTTGLRISEQRGLQWADLDESVPMIDVHQQIVRRKGVGLEFAQLKTSSSYRTIRLAPSVLRALKKHRAIQAAEHLKAGPKWEEHGLIFPGEKGRPMAPQKIRDAFTKILAELDLPRLTPHELRHTAATLMSEEGKHPQRVQKMMGHARSSTTLDLYSHVTPRSERDLADTMEAIIFG